MKTMTDMIFALVAGFILGCMLLCLGACSRKTPVESAFDSVGQAVTELQNTLPAECQTDAVLVKIADLRAETVKAQITCETKINDYKIKYERVLAVLGVIILAFLAKFYIKR